MMIRENMVGYDIYIYIPWRSSKCTFDEALIHSLAMDSWNSFEANPSLLQSPNTIGKLLHHLTPPQLDTATQHFFLSHKLL